MKKNAPLIIGLAIPVFMIILISLVVYVPSAMLKPVHSFIYATNDRNYGYGDRYSVVNGKLVKEFIPYPENDGSQIDPQFKPTFPTVRLFVYDPIQNKSREVSFDDARQFTINENIESPDGFVFVGQNTYYNDGIFGLFGSSRDRNTTYMKKGNVSKKINLITGSAEPYYYDNNIRFIGWIN